MSDTYSGGGEGVNRHIAIVASDEITTGGPTFEVAADNPSTTPVGGLIRPQHSLVLFAGVLWTQTDPSAVTPVWLPGLAPVVPVTFDQTANSTTALVVPADVSTGSVVLLSDAIAAISDLRGAVNTVLHLVNSLIDINQAAGLGA